MVPGSAHRRGLSTISVTGAALDAFERYLRDVVDGAEHREPLRSQLRHHFGLGVSDGARTGKRLRPRLVLAAARSFGGDDAAALPACAAVELLHNYSLIHDDIEDGDRLRHGRPTVWSAFGLAHGVNCGDAVGALAYKALEPLAGLLGTDIAYDMTAALVRAHITMCRGQSLDLAAEGDGPATIETYVEMIDAKTAALFACSARLGALCSRASEDDAARCADVGRHFGLCFQIRDDVAGVWGDTGHTGKEAGADLARRKKSFPVVWALEHAASGAGAAIRAAYGVPGAVIDDTTIIALRAELAGCGAREAAERAASEHASAARDGAHGISGLTEFVEAWGGG
ncbi:MAG TPA: polyprenyl synthetase family protein [Candidatus Eremiobacteraceae bacterium]|nr:polyprenyl synthetase family protein [Candidatus Eremiobacteraceae bacterium]